MEKTKKTGILVECSVLIAMAFVLSFIKIIDMPYGGAVTAASMLPIIIAGYRHGLKWGLITSFTYSILQLLTGLSNVSYATSTTAMIAIILLDYIVAFTVLGLLGVVRKQTSDRSFGFGNIDCLLIKIFMSFYYRMYSMGRRIYSNS